MTTKRAVFLGDSGVGKTALAKMHYHDKFLADPLPQGIAFILRPTAKRLVLEAHV